MKNTTNYGLNKPESTDFYNVDDMNSNMDVIDANLKKHEDDIARLERSNSSTGQSVTNIQFMAQQTEAELDSHKINELNPHNVTAEQVGLGNVNNTSDKAKPISDATQTALNAIDNKKVDKVNGKGLSTNDYTTNEKEKLAGIATGANAYTHPSYTARTGVPTANQTPAFGGTFSVTQPVSDVSGHITSMTSRTVKIPDTVASTSANGLMSSSDRAKMNNLEKDGAMLYSKYISASKTFTLKLTGVDGIIRISARASGPAYYGETLFHYFSGIYGSKNISDTSFNSLISLSLSGTTLSITMSQGGVINILYPYNMVSSIS